MARTLVSLSGGGFRSSLFNCGVLRTLYEAGMLFDEANLRSIAIVNSVSGGSVPSLIWDMFFKSGKYREHNESLFPEVSLIEIVSSAPRIFRRFNWNFRGAMFWADTAWRNYLWSKLSKMPRDVAPPLSVEDFRPRNNQSFPVFLVELLDYYNGDIYCFNHNAIFILDREFYMYGTVNIGVKTRKAVQLHDAIAAATAFPVVFRKANIYGMRFVDAGLIDNIGVFAFRHFLDSERDGKIGKGDTWVFSNASGSLSVPERYRRPLSFSNTVKRLGFIETIFRYTGDLAQPKMMDFVHTLLAAYSEVRLVGIHIEVSAREEPLWIKGDTITTPYAASQVPTHLHGMSRQDSLALIGYGAQCAANAVSLSEDRKQSIKDKLSRLTTADQTTV